MEEERRVADLRTWMIFDRGRKHLWKRREEKRRGGEQICRRFLRFCFLFCSVVSSMAMLTGFHNHNCSLVFCVVFYFFCFSGLVLILLASGFEKRVGKKVKLINMRWKNVCINILQLVIEEGGINNLQ